MLRTRLSSSIAIMLSSALFMASALSAPAQTLEWYKNFTGANGRIPQLMSLLQSTDGNLYGTTSSGGKYGFGEIFRVSPAGALTTFYSFCENFDGICPDGEAPAGTLALGPNGNLYGETQIGGPYNGGTIFEITPNGKLTTLYNFCLQTNCADGLGPDGGLTLATDGNFYGTTYYGGSGSCGNSDHGCGTAFKISPTGALSTIYNFCSLASCADGDNPYGGVIQATNGNLYGTTLDGGSYTVGTVFKLTLAGKLTTLHAFCMSGPLSCPDGYSPQSALIQGPDGNLYGTTTYGGGDGDYGTVFSISPAGGTLNTLHAFAGYPTDGSLPYSGLTSGSDGNFYGTTMSGGSSDADCNGSGAGCGTVYQITPAGVETVEYSFDATDGYSLSGGVVEGTNGLLYGTASNGGSKGYGTVFSLSVGLGAFVRLAPASGKVGASIKILGSDLTGTTAVSFNGTAASFAIVKSTEIKAVVPTGATSGTVTVTTPLGVLNSSVSFHVLK